MSSPVLELDGLVRRFRDITALDGLSFSVPEGTMFGFLGPNGAGKSTAMRAILRLIALDGGEVRWRGRAYGREACRRFGYMPEERGLYAGMRVGDHLAYLGELHGLSRGDARRAAHQWAERLGLGPRVNDKVGDLSLGNQQRAQVAAALAHRPELLVLDEPFSGLDPGGVDELAAVLAECAAAGTSVLFSSHQLDLVEHLCQAVAIVDHGRLVATGTVEELALGGRDRLVVEVDGDSEGRWVGGLGGVALSERQGSRVRLVLTGADANDVMDAARAAGTVVHFAFERRRLSEVFREAVAAGGRRG
jgi:ABC-2 type transport system ATP-binding protein